MTLIQRLLGRSGSDVETARASLGPVLEGMDNQSQLIDSRFKEIYAALESLDNRLSEIAGSMHEVARATREVTDLQKSQLVMAREECEALESVAAALESDTRDKRGAA